jgi:hypothetical protein
LLQKLASPRFACLQYEQTTGSLVGDCRMFSLAVVKACWISLAAVANAFSISWPIFENASLKSSNGTFTPASTPSLVRAPHREQKYASSESFSPHLEQKTVTITFHQTGTNSDLSVADFQSSAMDLISMLFISVEHFPRRCTMPSRLRSLTSS